MSDMLGETVLEQRLIREIGEVDQHIRELQNERRTLETLLLKARRENVAARMVTRRNSVSRILIETTIIETLRASKKPVSNYELYQSIIRRDPSVKNNTFRSYLHRLSQRDEIASLPGRRGVWKLGSQQS